VPCLSIDCAATRNDAPAIAISGKRNFQAHKQRHAYHLVHCMAVQADYESNTRIAVVKRRGKSEKTIGL
jgi:hypothetical protein